MFVDTGFSHPIRTAFDVNSNRSVPFSMIDSAVRSSIIHDYGVRPSELKEANGNVFEWATYPGDGEPHRSMEEFRKRYPH